MKKKQLRKIGELLLYASENKSFAAVLFFTLQVGCINHCVLIHIQLLSLLRCTTMGYKVHNLLKTSIQRNTCIPLKCAHFTVVNQK